MPQALKLECGNVVWIPFELKHQYPDDYHYVLCPHCIKLNRDTYAKRGYNHTAIAWQKVVKKKYVVRVPNVLDWNARVLPRDVLRIQPSVPRSRVHPFPYK